MFGSSKPIPFDPYRRRRSGWRLPRWLVLLLIGIALGAVGLYVAQERYLPPRLSASASTALRQDFETADAARTRLAGELADTKKRLDTALADRKRLSDEAAASRAGAEALRGDLNAVVASLPPDPRGGAVQVRAARFAVQGGTLNYDVLLTRDRAVAAKPIEVSVRLAVAGDGTRSFAPPSEAATVGGAQVVRGSVALPDGLRPRQVTVQVVDRAGRALGMRVLLVQ